MKKSCLFIILIILLASCKSTDKSPSVSEYENDFRQREVPYKNCFAVLPFTLNYTQPASYPIIKINNSFLLLDTGANYTCVGEKALQDLFYDNYENVMKQKNLITTDGNFNIFNQSIGYWTIPSYSGDYQNIPFYFSNYNFSAFDGIIGEDCFKKFSNIIIDYKNKVIVFNGEAIKGEELPMLIDEEGLCFIEFLCNGKKETGLIDTGSDDFILRSSFFEKPCEYNHNTIEKIEELKKREVKITEPMNYVFQDVSIGKMKYKKLSAKLASDSQLQMADEARGRLTEYSTLGFPFFENRIIQLDYKNKVFRIQK
ncbi:MAG: hypothetical protein IKQ84_10555 [Spirochaetaceae bacterium]|nr:hypothetical protein [Spirochaetaceae bacterium]